MEIKRSCIKGTIQKSDSRQLQNFIPALKIDILKKKILNIKNNVNNPFLKNPEKYFSVAIEILAIKNTEIDQFLISWIQNSDF